MQHKKISDIISREEEEDIKTGPVMLTGGGTLGPVTPLLAVAEEWRAQDPDIKFTWIGTQKGPEKPFVKKAGIPFQTIIAPKLSRGKKLGWLFIGPLLMISCAQSLSILLKERPRAVLSVGAYVSVPIAWMAWILRIPVFIHQLDVIPGLANKLMAPFARQITTTWKTSKKHFPKKKTTQIGGIVRPSLLDVPKPIKRPEGPPKVLIFGGGTGAASINKTMEIIGPDLAKEVHITHITGKGKMIPSLKKIGDTYRVHETLIEQMGVALRDADIVVGRAGMGTIMEMAALAKPTILIPIPNSHQVANAKIIEKKGGALVLYKTNPQIIKQAITKLARSASKRGELAVKINLALKTDGAGEFIKIVQGEKAEKKK